MSDLPPVPGDGPRALELMSVVAPIFNEEAVIPVLLRRLDATSAISPRSPPGSSTLGGTPW